MGGHETARGHRNDLDLGENGHRFLSLVLSDGKTKFLRIAITNTDVGRERDISAEGLT